MALSLNLTVVVQVINFFIAYLFITQFFLKPGYRAFKVEEERMRQLRETLLNDQQELAQRELYKSERWRLCQGYFTTNRPTLESETGGLKSTTAIEPLEDCSPQEYKESVQEISQRLLKEFTHD